MKSHKADYSSNRWIARSQISKGLDTRDWQWQSIFQHFSLARDGLLQSGNLYSIGNRGLFCRENSGAFFACDSTLTKYFAEGNALGGTGVVNDIVCNRRQLSWQRIEGWQWVKLISRSFLCSLHNIHCFLEAMMQNASQVGWPHNERWEVCGKANKNRPFLS